MYPMANATSPRPRARAIRGGLAVIGCVALGCAGARLAGHLPLEPAHPRARPASDAAPGARLVRILRHRAGAGRRSARTAGAKRAALAGVAGVVAGLRLDLSRPGDLLQLWR